MKKIALIFLIALCPLLGLAQAVERVLLTSKPATPAKKVQEFLEQQGISSQWELAAIRVWVVEASNPDQLQNRAKQSGLFSLVELDQEHQGELDWLPNDPSFGQQWYLRQASDRDIDADEAWELLPDFPSVTVAMLDGGLEISHPDLIGMVDSPFNAVTNQPSNAEFVNDLDRHGTACSGTIAALTNNSLGVASAGANRVRVMPINIMSTTNGSSFSTTTSIQLNAINAAMQNPNCVAIAMSYSSNSQSPTLAAAFQVAATEARDGKGLFVCASTGNNNNAAATNYPANYPAVYGIGATSSSDLRASFSNHGNIVDISAPGVSIMTTDRLGQLGYTSNDFTSISGTSFSCPITASCAALLIYKNPQLSSAETMSALAQGAEKVGGYAYDYNPAWPYSTRSTQLGYGRVNLRAALELIENGTPPPPPAPKHNILVQSCNISDAFPEMGELIVVNVVHATTLPGLPAVTSRLQFRLSNDAIWSSDDLVLKTDTVILGGGIASVPSSISYAPTSYGIKHILVKADALDQVEEYIESDNFCSRQFEVLTPTASIDLQVIIDSQPWTGCTNTPQPQLRYRFKNVGTTTITGWSWKVYWQHTTTQTHNFNSSMLVLPALIPGANSGQIVNGFNYTSFPEGVTVTRCVELVGTTPGPDQQTFNNVGCMTFTRNCGGTTSSDFIVIDEPVYTIYTISGQKLDARTVDELPHGIYIVKAQYMDHFAVEKIAK